MNHPCCLITDLLIMKDLIQKEQESSLEKEARAYQHKLSTISKLASGVGHEVNNPLMVIKGQVMALRKKRDKENDLEAKLGKIDKSIDKIANIAKSLRDFSQIGMTSIKKVNLNKLIKITCSHLEELIEEKKIAIILDMPVEDIDILGDENRLQTCMTHLILNSIDATETSISKDIKISLTAEGDFCFLHIEDEGCGIPENIEDKIFEPFFHDKRC